MKHQLKPLPPAEWLLMRGLWDLGSGSPTEVASHVLARYNYRIAPKSVGIFLARLTKKGVLSSTAPPPVSGRGRHGNIYQPLVSFKDALKVQLSQFLADHAVDDEETFSLLEALISESRKATGQTG